MKNDSNIYDLDAILFLATVDLMRLIYTIYENWVYNPGVYNTKLLCSFVHVLLIIILMTFSIEMVKQEPWQGLFL